MISVMGLHFLNSKKQRLTQTACFALAALCWSHPSMAQIDHSKIDYDIVIFDAETIARLNAPKLSTPSVATPQTGTITTAQTQSSTLPASTQTTPTQTTTTQATALVTPPPPATSPTTTSPTTTSPATTSPATTSPTTTTTAQPVITDPSTVVATQPSPFPVDISAQYTDVVSGVPIITNPESCGNGQLEIGVTLNKVANSKGSIVADLHDDVKENFLVWNKVVLRIRATATEGITKFCIPLTKPGDYAVAIYHDKNNNKKFDKNFLGIPRERFGMSNNPKFGLKSPEYEEAVFSVPASGTEINITMFKASDIL